MQRFKVSGPFRRNGKRPYYTVVDTFKKHVVSQHPRKADAYDEATKLERTHTGKVVDVT